MKKLLFLLPAACAAFLITGCVDEPYYGRVYERPVYGPGVAYSDGDYYGPSGGVDFYYEGGVPYSREYGPLVFRDNQYYYSRGGNYITYDRERYGGRRGGGGGRDYAYERGRSGGGRTYGYARGVDTSRDYHSSDRAYQTQRSGSSYPSTSYTNSSYRGSTYAGAVQRTGGNQFAGRAQYQPQYQHQRQQQSRQQPQQQSNRGRSVHDDGR